MSATKVEDEIGFANFRKNKLEMYGRYAVKIPRCTMSWLIILIG